MRRTGTFIWRLFLAWGPLGVDIFFILSGFLITRLLMIEVRRTGRISFENFYIRRFLRLGPALIAMFAVYGLLIGLHLLTDLNRATFLYSVLYMRNIKGMGASTGHLWSLSLEEQFYLLWPALFWIGGKRATKIAFALTLAVIAIRMGSILQNPQMASAAKIEWRPWFRMDAILIGSLFALVADRQDRWWVGFQNSLGKLNAGILWPAVLGLTIFAPQYSSYYITLRIMLAALLFLQLMAQKDGPYSRLLSTPLFVLVGRLSYSLYLWQQLFLYAKTPDWGVVRRFPLDIVLTITCAAVSYYFIETPFLRLKKRFERRSAGLQRTPAMM